MCKAMAQPFEDAEEGFAQRLSKEEIVAGAAAFNLRYLSRVKVSGNVLDKLTVYDSDGPGLGVSFERTPPRLVGGGALRDYFHRIGVGPGDWLRVAFLKPGIIVMHRHDTESSAPAFAASIVLDTALKATKPHMATNTILYGPPGTGKTYATTRRAVEICDGALSASDNRDAVRSRYEELRSEGRICFVTFHQSYGYEDFVEGLRPQTNAAGQITYNVVPGVFRRACDLARSSGKLNPVDIDDDLILSPESPPLDVASVKPYVLIIDEINRANISKVFGELITLLEPDKRKGAPNAITLKLPFSGDFTVPANLHVLGTMNTADRSIALLDTALRRRFDFEEMTPDPAVLNDHVVEGIELAKLLAAMNDRVEALYDRDHMIGHAFFIGVKTLERLEQVFRRKVLPLLQEYFYENASKVRRVLNDLGEGEFVQRKKASVVPPDGQDTYSDEQRMVYSVNRNPFPVAAYQRIYAAN